MRIALGVSYAGQRYRGWQSQSDGGAVQNHLEAALEKFCGRSGRVATLCAGRTDAGVHALMQVVHFDTDLVRAPFSWVRGTNAWLPPDIAVQWAQPVSSRFHARACAQARRYAYVLLQSAVRPSLEAARVGWVHQALSLDAMREAASHLIGEHDFSAFRAAGCQAISPLKTLHHIHIHQRLEPGPHGMPVGYWRFDFCGNAFLHHMVRNIMGCLVAVGQGRRPPQWLRAVRESRQRSSAAPTFSAAGLYFLGPLYDPAWGLPQRVEALDALPFASG